MQSKAEPFDILLLAAVLIDQETTSLHSVELEEGGKIFMFCTLDDAELIAFGLFCAYEKKFKTATKITILELAESILEGLVRLEHPKCDERLKTVKSALSLLRKSP